MNESVKSVEPHPCRVALTSSCPRCGTGRLFNGYLTLVKECEHCSLDMSNMDSGDGPAVFIMFIVGFIVVGSALYVELSYQPPYWVHGILWLPLTLILSFGLLRPLKALMIALQYKYKARQGELDTDGND